MLIEVLNDIQTFAIVTIFSLLMFSGTFYILDQNNAKTDIYLPTYLNSVKHTYELMLGQFDTTNFGPVGNWVVYFVFIMASLLLIVVMLNLLIAIISDTYAGVDSQKERMMYKEFAQLICENRHLLSPKDIERADS